MINRILVICVGNICRSPMAEGLLRQALPNSSVSSAGLGALVGNPADPTAIQLMQERGVDITAHRARQVNGQLMADADLVLVMELAHQRYLEQQYPLSRGKIFRVCERSKADVADPYRQGLDAFRQSLHLIAEGVEAWGERIMALSGQCTDKSHTVQEQ